MLVARQERARRAYTPEEIRSRLHSRYDAIAQAERAGLRDGDVIDLTSP